MKSIVSFLSALLLTSLALGQSVPNGGTITQGQVWTAPQWTTAWQSKADALNGVLTSPSMIGAVNINGVPPVTYPLTPAEFSASVTPTSFTNPPGNVLRYGAAVGIDCTAAVQNAAASNKQVTFPAGAWLISSTPTVPPDVVISALPGASFTGAGAIALGLQLTDSFQTYLLEGDTITGLAFRDVSRIQHIYGGSGMQGGRNSLEVQSSLVSTSSASNVNRNYTAAQFQGQASANDNGTSSTVRANADGAVFGLNGVGILYSGATNFLNITAAEFDVAAQTGSSVWARTGIQVDELGSAAVQGSVYDMGIAVTSQIGAVGWNIGLGFSAMSTQQPINSTGTIIATVGASTVANGVDFSSYTITGSAWKSTGFVVDGSGNAKLNSAIATGTTFPVSGCGAAGARTGGATAGSFTVGTGASPCTFVITLPTAPHGWVCHASDATSAVALPDSGTASVNSCSVKGNAATSDLIVFSAMGY